MRPIWNSASRSPPATVHGDNLVDAYAAALAALPGMVGGGSGSASGWAIGMKEAKEWQLPWAWPSSAAVSARAVRGRGRRRAADRLQVLLPVGGEGGAEVDADGGDLLVAHQRAPPTPR
ncbi:hypothetical protein ACFY04_42330 [Streptomyces sp. NPDC001549]|uniref:hypothetical protein n=1 Tax=Streptomyces sp. NPDC001549 TaxID=3364586 RepID=UPI00368A56DA